MTSDKILIGKKSIMQYIGVSHSMLNRLVNHGLPARNENNKWYAHTDNLDKWFKNWTYKKNES